jgi:hypothetical protein
MIGEVEQMTDVSICLSVCAFVRVNFCRIYSGECEGQLDSKMLQLKYIAVDETLRLLVQTQSRREGWCCDGEAEFGPRLVTAFEFHYIVILPQSGNRHLDTHSPVQQHTFGDKKLLLNADKAMACLRPSDTSRIRTLFKIAKGWVEKRTGA